MATATSPVRADDSERARALFDQADAALDEGRFAEARDLLRQSLDAHPHPAAAFNLAIALRGTGELLAAIETFERLLAGRFGALPDDRRAEVAEPLAELRAAIATIRVRACGAERITIRLDGEETDALETTQGCASTELRVDPGLHVVTADAPRAESVQRRVEAERGGTARVALTVAPAPVPTAPDDEPSVLSSPWLWLAAGVLVAAGVGLTLFFASGPDDHVTDDVFGETITLRF
jgi:hypothetical protein